MEPKILTLIEDVNNSAPEPKDIQTLIAQALIPQGIEIPKPDLVFAINDIPLFTKKSISTLIGKAKAGKTTVTSWIVSQSIKEEINTLWIDTEQGQYYGSRTQFWILKISGLTTSNKLHFYDLKIHSPQQRIEMIELIIKELKPDLVIVDGIRDLVYDINSPEEATTKTGALMRWAEEYDCHIMVVLHQNKGNDHARGHLGTEMINKSETVVKVEQNEEKLIVCYPEYTRSKAFDIFAFNRDEHGIPYIVDGFAGSIATQSGEGKSKKKVDPTDPSFEVAHHEIIQRVFSVSQFLKYDDLISNIRHYFKIYGVDMGVSKAKEFYTHYIQCGIIWANPYVKGFAKYEKNPTYVPKPTFAPPTGPKEMNADGLFIKPSHDDEDPPF
jgi:KaiC/GvpD/RAD55 family RecA-like ATPase